MKRNSFVILLAVLAIAAAAIVWSGSHVASAATVQPDATSLALIPGQAIGILGVDVDGLRSSAIYNNFLQNHPPKTPSGDFAEFVAATGFDPRRDITGVTAGGWKNGTEPAGVAVVTAHYNSASVASFVKSKGGVVETYNGFELIEPEKHGADRPAEVHPALVFLDDNTILVGTNAAVKLALDLKAGSGTSVLANQALLTLVTQIGAQNQIWGAATSPGSLLPIKLAPLPGGPIPPANQAKIISIIQGLQSVTFGINAASDVNLTSTNTCASAADAQALADTINGLLALGRMMLPPNQTGPIQVLNSVKVVQNSNDVRVTAQIPADLIQKFTSNPDVFFHHRDTK